MALTSTTRYVGKSAEVIIGSVRGAGLRMAVRRAIKRSDALTILARQMHHFVKRLRYARKWNDATKTYLATHQVRKLEIGARVASSRTLPAAFTRLRAAALRRWATMS